LVPSRFPDRVLSRTALVCHEVRSKLAAIATTTSISIHRNACAVRRVAPSVPLRSPGRPACAHLCQKLDFSPVHRECLGPNSLIVLRLDRVSSSSASRMPTYSSPHRGLGVQGPQTQMASGVMNRQLIIRQAESRAQHSKKGRLEDVPRRPETCLPPATPVPDFRSVGPRPAGLHLVLLQYEP